MKIMSQMNPLEVFREAEIYFPKINIPFGPLDKNYPTFRQVNHAIDGLLGWSSIFNIFPTLTQRVDFPVGP